MAWVVGALVLRLAAAQTTASNTLKVPQGIYTVSAAWLNRGQPTRIGQRVSACHLVMLITKCYQRLQLYSVQPLGITL